MGKYVIREGGFYNLKFCFQSLATCSRHVNE